MVIQNEEYRDYTHHQIKHLTINRHFQENDYSLCLLRVKDNNCLFYSY